MFIYHIEHTEAHVRFEGDEDDLYFDTDPDTDADTDGDDADADADDDTDTDG